MASREPLDQSLSCAACGDSFIFSAGEQELYRLRGITTQPLHCPSCVRDHVLARPPERGQDPLLG